MLRAATFSAMGKKKPQPPPPPPKAQGKDKKRTPTSAFDPAAGSDVYEPEKIVGETAARRRTGWGAMVGIWLVSGCGCVLSGEPDSVSCSGGAC